MQLNNIQYQTVMQVHLTGCQQVAVFISIQIKNHPDHNIKKVHPYIGKPFPYLQNKQLIEEKLLSNSQ